MPRSFVQLNDGWNADPNVPEESARVDGHDVLLSFGLNSFQFPEFKKRERGILRFVNCSQFRIGDTNDEGWYLGQCRFSGSAPAWGEFYAIAGDAHSADGPRDWIVVDNDANGIRVHFLFYFRDSSFECLAENCVFEPTQENALFKKAKRIPPLQRCET